MRCSGGGGRRPLSGSPGWDALGQPRRKDNRKKERATNVNLKSNLPAISLSCLLHLTVGPKQLTQATRPSQSKCINRAHLGASCKYDNLSEGPKRLYCLSLSLSYTYRNQSTATIMVISSVGRPTAVSTMIMVTRPAEGTAAAPKEAAVEVSEIIIKSGSVNTMPFI